MARELVVLELVVDFVVGSIAEAAHDKSEENAHVGVVVEGHHSAFLDEEENEPIVIII